MLKFSLQINQRAGADCHWCIRQFPLSSLLTLQRYYLAKAKSRKRRIVNTIVLAIDAEMRLKRLYIIRYKALLPLPFSVGSFAVWGLIGWDVWTDWLGCVGWLAGMCGHTDNDLSSSATAECPLLTIPHGHNKHYETSLHFASPILFLFQL